MDLTLAQAHRRRWNWIFLAAATLFFGPLLTSSSLLAVEPPAKSAVSVFDKSVPETLDDLRELQQRTQDVADKVMPYTVHVRVGAAQGSGVIVSSDGYILTAGHVSGAPEGRAVITLSDGRRVRGKALGRNVDIDSGLIVIDEEDAEGQWPHAEMGDSADLRQGQWCLSVGHPGGLQRGRAPVVRLGRVLRISDDLIQTDCTLISGDSGGPLFDMQGRVIGVHSRIARPLNMNFHVPVARYTGAWDRLAAAEEWGGRPRGPIIGIRGEDSPDGCRVVEVFEALPAKEAGLQSGDVISRVNGKRVRGLGDLIEQLSRFKPGDEVRLEYFRDAERVTRRLVLAPRP